VDDEESTPPAMPPACAGNRQILSDLADLSINLAALQAKLRALQAEVWQDPQPVSGQTIAAQLETIFREAAERCKRRQP